MQPTSESPTVSVILPFFRNPLVVEAVRSILDQTWTDFELIAIDDCSGNGVADLLRGISDPRFRLVERETNGGENATRNHGIELARGKYIAFQDHDDVSYPDRLKVQVAHLESHPKLLGIGAGCHYGDDRIPHLGPTDERVLWWEMIFNNHVMFPTVMVRTEVARRHPFGNLVATDDYRWLLEVMREGGFVNIPDVVFHYRMQPTSLSNERSAVQMGHLDTFRGEFAKEAGVTCGPDDIELLRWLGTPRSESWPDAGRLRDAAVLLERLVHSFCEKRPGDRTPMVKSASGRMRYAVTVSAGLGIPAWKAWWSLQKRLGRSRVDRRLLVKCLLSGLRTPR
jgi:glycosyltransferase involved in cell wall biosynthesis